MRLVFVCGVARAHGEIRSAAAVTAAAVACAPVMITAGPFLFICSCTNTVLHLFTVHKLVSALATPTMKCRFTAIASPRPSFPPITPTFRLFLWHLCFLLLGLLATAIIQISASADDSVSYATIRSTTDGNVKIVPSCSSGPAAGASSNSSCSVIVPALVVNGQQTNVSLHIGVDDAGHVHLNTSLAASSVFVNGKILAPKARNWHELLMENTLIGVGNSSDSSHPHENFLELYGLTPVPENILGLDIVTFPSTSGLRFYPDTYNAKWFGSDNQHPADFEIHLRLGFVMAPVLFGNLYVSVFPKFSLHRFSVFYNVREPGDGVTFTSSVGGYEAPFNPTGGNPKTNRNGPTPSPGCTSVNDTYFDQEVRFQFRNHVPVFAMAIDHLCDTRPFTFRLSSDLVSHMESFADWKDSELEVRLDATENIPFSIQYLDFQVFLA